MKKQVLLILLLLVGVSMIGEGKTYAAEVKQETSIYFENTYIPEPDVEDNLTPGISIKPDAPNQNQNFPQTGEKGRNKGLFSLGMVLLFLGLSYILVKISEWIFYKKKKIEEESLNMKVSKLALVGILSTSILAGGAQISYAAEGGTVNTLGDVTFEQDDTITPPVDPLDPSNPLVPVDPDVPGGTAGPLSIDYVSNFHFGNQKITSKDMTYNVSLDKFTDSEGTAVTRPTFVQVTDNRGTNTGWSLQVQQGAQFSAKVDTEDVELAGASITMKNSTVTSTDDNLATPPTAASTITLTPGTSEEAGALKDVMIANEDEGMSTWVNLFGTEVTGEESVTLFVPGTSTKVKDATYKTSLTWVLSDTPA